MEMKSRQLNRATARKYLQIVFCTAALMLALAAPAQAGNAMTGKAEDFQRLQGNWVRPDGGYVLELRHVKQDGSLQAAYFNPVPIRVHRAGAGKKNGRITVFVELRDANYPGSTYTLVYDPKTDRLRGAYYQAVHRQTFNVEFMRAR